MLDQIKQQLKELIKELSIQELYELQTFIDAEIKARQDVNAPKVRVLFPPAVIGDRRKAHGGTYVKLVRRVDTSRTNGYAFEGDFLPLGREVDIAENSIIVIASGVGSWRHPKTLYWVLRVQNGASWTCSEHRNIVIKNVECIAEFTDAQFLTLRDFVHSVLNQ